jgi:serine/threonine protein kinase
MLNGRYDLQQPLGGGGMGQVWRAVDIELDRTVAVKMPLQQLAHDPTYVGRFLREARTMAAIKHPNVISIYDVGRSEFGPFLVMEYIDGESLSQVLHRQIRLPPHVTMRLVADAARGLHAAHEKEVVHRDIKPGNLLLRADGAVVLTDFGIAKTPTANVLTAPGELLRTATYLAPHCRLPRGAHIGFGPAGTHLRQRPGDRLRSTGERPAHGVSATVRLSPHYWSALWRPVPACMPIWTIPILAIVAGVPRSRRTSEPSPRIGISRSAARMSIPGAIKRNDGNAPLTLPRCSF